jgi:Zn-dependent protease with chaperone function
MPKLRIIETDARNAFASGVRSRAYSVTVTRD